MTFRLHAPLAFVLSAALPALALTGCTTTQQTSQKKAEPAVAYETVTPTGSHRILRQKKNSAPKDPHEEAIRDRTIEAWGREADRLLVEVINGDKPQ